MGLNWAFASFPIPGALASRCLRQITTILSIPERQSGLIPRAPIGIDPESGYLLFQSRNISQAEIRGIDMRLSQNLDGFAESLGDWNLDAALYWSKGKNLDNGQALNSVSPPQAVVGLSWVSFDDNWTSSVTATLTRRQDEIDHSGSQRFETPGYSTFDFSIGYRLNNWLEMRGAIRNLTDRHYWRWSDISRLNAADPMIDLLSQPGRNYSLSLRASW
jgi:hemoglobin/transferrin/lactoferrin receptor protein